MGQYNIILNIQLYHSPLTTVFRFVPNADGELQLVGTESNINIGNIEDLP